jgi:putative peptide zinc metalloprotease protein
LRSDLVVSQTTTGGQIVYTIKDPVAGQYFRLREPEYWLIGQFDGVTTPEAAAQLFREKWNLDISAEDVRKFVDTLDRLLFLDNPHAEQATSRAGSSGRPQKSLAERIFFLKLRAFHPGRFLDRLEQIYRPFHRPFWFVVQLIVIAVGLSLLWANSSYFAVRLSELYSVTSIVIIVVSLFILITFHEFAHAVVCRYYGGQVREMGFLLMYFQPCFYCDVSDAWLFSERRHRLAVTFAGPYFQLFLLALAMIVWRLTVPGTAISEVARLIVIVGWVSYLFNFNPLIKLDGYYLLSDWLEIPNLRSKSFAYLKNAFARNLLGWPIDRLPATRRERRVFIGYAVLALAYTGFLIVYILILIGRFLAEKAGTLGLILLFAVLVVIFRRNLAALGRAVVQHVRYMKQILKKPLRIR